MVNRVAVRVGLHLNFVSIYMQMRYLFIKRRAYGGIYIIMRDVLYGMIFVNITSLEFYIGILQGEKKLASDRAGL